MTWEVVIGLETHTQLSTASKIFSGASTAFGAAPNTQASAVDIALPGVLPVLNKGAVERAIRFGLAVGGTINKRSVFARKNYFYPDLPKGYQISQYEIPVVQGGSITIPVLDGEKTVHLTRAHLEEDAGKSLHEDFRGMSGIDLNRAGTPLLEIVSEPEMSSSDEAVAYAKTLHALVRWIGICDGNMQEGSFRCDANVSVRRTGAPLGTRCEIKNLNSFRFMQEAIEFEVRRQVALIEEGGKVVQETRLYDPDKHETRSMRSKEDAQDYRYFPDPDLPPLVIEQKWIDNVRAELGEFPNAAAARLQGEHGFPRSLAYEMVTERQRVIDFDHACAAFDKLANGLGEVQERAANFRSFLLMNFILQDIAAFSNDRNLPYGVVRLTPETLAKLVFRNVDGTISTQASRKVLRNLLEQRGAAKDVDPTIEQLGLVQISDAGEIERFVEDVLAANPAIVAEYRAGKEKAFNSLVGKVMAASKGKANPAQVNELLKKKLGG